MRERPILFSAPMVRAILAGTKTQTRRVVKRIPWRAGVNPDFSQARPFHNAGEWRIAGSEEMTSGFRCPYGQPGDRLWVRETWAVRLYASDPPQEGCGDWHVYYEADGFHELRPEAGAVKIGRGAVGRLRPSIHMPRWASRITLEVTGVRVERLHDITEADAIAEGVDPSPGIRGDDDLMVQQVMSAHSDMDKPMMPAPVARYVLLWDSINGKQPGVTNWNANPWVWVIEFRRVTAEAELEHG